MYLSYGTGAMGATMLGLLNETITEMKSKPVDLFRCFWPSVALALASFLIAASFSDLIRQFASESELEANILMFMAVFAGGGLVFAATIAPGVIRWHRFLIADQPTSWLPPVPFKSTITYTLLAGSIGFLYVAIQKVFGSLYQDLLFPVVGLVTGSVGLKAIPWLLDPSLNFLFQFADYVFGFLSAILLGRLYLRLPEISLEAPLRGARKAWTKKQKWAFYLALGTIFLSAFLMQRLDDAIWASINDIASILFFLPVSIVFSLFFWAAGITLLSVAYRRNLVNRDKENSSVIFKPE